MTKPPCRVRSPTASPMRQTASPPTFGSHVPRRTARNIPTEYSNRRNRTDNEPSSPYRSARRPGYGATPATTDRSPKEQTPRNAPRTVSHVMREAIRPATYPANRPSGCDNPTLRSDHPNRAKLPFPTNVACRNLLFNFRPAPQIATVHRINSTPQSGHIHRDILPCHWIHKIY